MENISKHKIINNFIVDTFKLFCNNIDIPNKYKSYCKIDSNIMYYFADSNNQIIYVNKKYILEVDISSAFTTFCNILYDNTTEFVKNINNITDKFERNKYIAQELKGGTTLKEFNILCKTIIIGILFDIEFKEELDNLEILEIKKDGVVIKCNGLLYNRLLNINNSQNKFSKFILNHSIKIKIKEYTKYIRQYKTSIFSTENDIIIKGIYKNIPINTYKLMKNIVIYNKYNENDILTIYNTNLINDIKLYCKNNIIKYYITDNNMYINNNLKYNIYDNKSIIYPRIYLKLFIYPCIKLILI